MGLGVVINRIQTMREDFTTRAHIRFKRTVCTYNGHLWRSDFFNPTTGQITYRCLRCFPHKDSLKATILYDPTSEHPTDPFASWE